MQCNQCEAICSNLKEYLYIIYKKHVVHMQHINIVYYTKDIV